jgi:hypothetical protein
MSTRRSLPAVVALGFALFFFGLGNYLGARQNADTEAQFAALRAELSELRHREPLIATGTAGRVSPTPSAVDLDAIVDDVKRRISDEMGLFPLDLLRERRQSFVELYSYDDRGSSSYGTAGYLGNGYFITVKHGVVALGQEGLADPRKITSVKIAYDGKLLNARVVDYGDAKVEVDPGDWAIVKVKEKIELPALNPNLAFGFDFADPIFRLGNDYSKGIIVATGYVGQKTPNSLVT